MFCCFAAERSTAMDDDAAAAALLPTFVTTLFTSSPKENILARARVREAWEYIRRLPCRGAIVPKNVHDGTKQ